MKGRIDLKMPVRPKAKLHPGLFVKMIWGALLLITGVWVDASAQALVTGQVTDEEFAEPLEKAIVQVRGTGVNTVTDRNGNFTLRLPAGFYQVEAIHPGIYSEYYNVSLFDGILTPMGAVRLAPKAFGRPEQRNIAAFVNVDQHPLETKNIRLSALMDQSGSSDFNELLMVEPSACLQENGGGYGQSELGFRGFGPGQTSVVFNGIRLNNPETGAMNSPLYTGLSDWAGELQFTVGPASGKQSQLGYGGLINLLPLMPNNRFGVSVSGNYGQGNYLKTSGTLHTGKGKNKLAAVLKIDRTAGDGFADQSGYESYGLYFNLISEINHMHSLFFTVAAKSWQADQRNQPDLVSVYGQQGFEYNNAWGFRNDEPVSWDQSFGVNPLAMLTHHWHMRVNTRLVTQLYGELENSVESFPAGSVNGLSALGLPRDERALVPFDFIYSWNSGEAVPELGDQRVSDEGGQFINSEQDGLSLLGRATQSNRVGWQTQLIHDFDKRTRFFAGFDAMYHRGKHFGVVMDSWGADGFRTLGNVNFPEGVATQNWLQAGFFPKLRDADKVSFDYEAAIRQSGMSGKIQTVGNRAFWYLEGAVSLHTFQRHDYFSYPDGDSRQSSGKSNYLGYRLVSGLTYRLNEHHSLRLNLGGMASPPSFVSVFPAGNNWKNRDADPGNLYHSGLAWVISGGKVYLSAGTYVMYLQDQGWLQQSFLNDDEQFAWIYDADQLHYGAELSSQAAYLRRFSLTANASWGKWTYQSDAKARIYSSSQEMTGERDMPVSGYFVPNAPQLSFYVKNEMRLAKGFLVNVNYYRALNRYAPLLLHDFDEPGVNLPEQLKLEWYDRIGAGASFFRELKKQRTVHFSVDVQNLLNNEFIDQIFTNYSNEEQFLNNQVYFGKGQTWRLGLTFSF
ncbi:carboxypeptidase regulatory-like domain-containing protein [Gaoshiqia sediminis]|uniref:TonB-dependent receptor n=1 Tax=Gaoshiqia sediminis TaxID=2986998 RepID=A0AA41YA53_9BACT|nr:carboxypeptidase regulatory-like domain-containing protein [Gaoshiqia sediminis]MCW0483778.1 TonB-dependent receptor [Gaoshiqia sediminis]